jgi:hypothetical protein
MWCIHKVDYEKYEKLMISRNYEPRIQHDYGDKVQVMFPGEILEIWVAVGYWFGSCD